MPSLTRIVISLLFSIILIMACNSSPENKDAHKIADTTTHQANIENLFSDKKDSIVLKSIILDEKTVIDKRLLAKSKLLQEEHFTGMSINNIDSTPGKKGFKFHMLDTLFAGHTIKVYLIGREYTEENIIWIVVYNKDNNLLDSKELYYDNSEGFKSITSVIKSNQIAITISNDYAETDAAQKMKLLYFLDESGRILKKE